MQVPPNLQLNCPVDGYAYVCAATNPTYPIGRYPMQWFPLSQNPFASEKSSMPSGQASGTGASIKQSNSNKYSAHGMYNAPFMYNAPSMYNAHGVLDLTCRECQEESCQEESCDEETTFHVRTLVASSEAQ
jgi:hypothetical protein